MYEQEPERKTALILAEIAMNWRILEIPKKRLKPGECLDMIIEKEGLDRQVIRQIISKDFDDVRF